MGQHKALKISLILWIPVVILLCAAIVVWVILPNSKAESETVTVKIIPESRISPSADNTTTSRDQVVIGRNNGREVLFILGIIFASGLFVFLLVLITLVCVWARQTRGYAIGRDPLFDRSVEVAGNEEIQLKEHSNGGIGKCIKQPDSLKEEDPHNLSLVNSSSPPLETVVVSSQVNGENTEHKSGPPDELLCSQSTYDLKATHPQNYGTLSRTRLLSSVDEDGYHIDNLGFDLDADNSNCDFLPTSSSPETSLLDDNTRNLLEKLEEELQRPSGDSTTSPLASPKTNSASGSRESSVQRQLTKEDSFQGLPPLNSFDNYLTLVRLDSTTSLSSSSLEEARKQWQSIEEEEEIDNLGNTLEIDNKEEDP